MILVLDVGNTNVVLGVYNEDILIKSWRISTNKERTDDEYGVNIRLLFQYANLDPTQINGIIISSVVPPLTGTLERMAIKYFGVEPLIVGPGMKTGLPIKYDNPKEVGADRIVNAVAAIELYGSPLIIVDFGTATTFCAINQNSEYLGGAIAPGIGISTEALVSRAAKLPKIELVKPKNIIGKNTITSMQAGIIYGYVGQVDGIVNRIKKEIGTNAKVIATGGFAELIRQESQTIDIVNPDLTLQGLRIIYNRNKRPDKECS